MRLLIARSDGTLVEVLSYLEDYDLTRTLARQTLVDEVQRAIERDGLLRAEVAAAKARSS